MTKATKREAATVHRLLSYSPITGEFEHNKDNPLECGLLIIDEVSMLGMPVFSSLLDAVSENTMLVLVGDSNQLPSVDYGKILEDMIESKKFVTTELTEIYRQKKGSTLASRILDVSKGKMFSLQNATDFTFVDEKNPENVMDELITQYDEAIANVKDISEIAVLSPTNKGYLGVDNLNAILQEKMNPPGRGIPEIIIGKRAFRIGDPVIQCKNEHEYDVFNGMVGKVTRIFHAVDKDDIEYIEVTFPEGICEYTRDRYDKLKLAYALTIHKTQGSEYDRVIMLIPDEYKNMAERRLIYTGMSRAKKNLCIIGNHETIQNGIKKGSKIKRNTLLKYRIQEI